MEELRPACRPDRVRRPQAPNTIAPAGASCGGPALQRVGPGLWGPGPFQHRRGEAELRGASPLPLYNATQEGTTRERETRRAWGVPEIVTETSLDGEPWI